MSFYATLTNALFSSVKFLQSSGKGASNILDVRMGHSLDGMGDDRVITVVTDHGAFEITISPVAASTAKRRMKGRLTAAQVAAREVEELTNRYDHDLDGGR